MSSMKPMPPKTGGGKSAAELPLLAAPATPSELVDVVGWIPFAYRSLVELSARIDPGSELTRRALEEAIVDRRGEEFTRLFVACSLAGGMPGVWVLAGGASLFTDIAILFRSFLKMEGDPHEPVFEAVRSGHLSPEVEVSLLQLLWFWREKNGIGDEAPALRQAQRRTAMRIKRLSQCSPIVRIVLASISQVSGDPELLRLVGSGKAIPAETIVAATEKARRNALAEIDWRRLVPEHESISEGGTVRRVAPRAGRNDPCHCGSGKKYKKCCAARDEEEQPAYAIDGLEPDAIAAHPERRLTPRNVREFNIGDLYHVDPTKLEPPVFAAVVKRLAAFREGARVRKMIDFLGPEKVSPDLWEDLIFEFLFARDKESIRWAIPYCGPDVHVAFEARVLASELPDALGMVVEKLREAYRLKMEGNSMARVSFTEAAHCSAMIDPALGLIVARGVAIGEAESVHFDTLRGVIESARIEIGLSGDDPIFAWMLEESDAEEREWQHQAELEKERALAENRIALRQREAESLKARLASLQKELDRSEREEKEKSRGQAASASFAASEPEAIRSRLKLEEMREKARILKRNLKQEHEDHARDRDALHAARVELQRLQEAGLRNREDSGERREPDDGSAGEEPFLGDDVEPQQAVRVPEFGEDFRRALDTFDARVAAAAVTLAGRLAAGDSHAWRGVRKLRMRPDVLRQKVGRQHRLFFKSNAATLAIIDLIDRRDLEDWLRRG